MVKKKREIIWERMFFWYLAAGILVSACCLISIRMAKKLYEDRLFGLLEQKIGMQQTGIIRDLASTVRIQDLEFVLPGTVVILLVVFGWYFWRKLWEISENIRQLGLEMEQMVAGKKKNLARWEEGVLAGLANQAELLYRRNGHMVQLVQQEKEQICRFVENMVHQMKTPLTALWLNLDLMEARLASGGTDLPEEFRDAMEKKMEDCCIQCGMLKEKTAEFLQAGRFDAGKMTMLPAPADTEALIGQAVQELEPLLKKRRIRIDVDSFSKVPLYCDSGWIKAAFSNIIKNSSEAMEHGGKIRIRHWDEAGWKYVEFRDEGGGFSQEEAEHLFERFYTGQSREGGSGLGLYIAKEVAAATHGDLTAESVPEKEDMGEGARFLMKFRILSGAETYGE